MAGSPGPFRVLEDRVEAPRRNSARGTWDKVLAALLTRADARGLINWEVSVDSTVNRAHQHGTNLPRHTGGPLELQESA